MPAAPLRERRGNTRTRAASAAARPRSRPQRQGNPAAGSKLEAARAVGLTGPTAIAVAGLLAALVLVAALATGGRGHAVIEAGAQVARGAGRLAQEVRGLVQGRFAGLGFKVGAVHLQGASPASQNEILAAAAVRPGQPLLDLDLDAIRGRVERVGWVAHARVIRLFPDTVVISVAQRPLVAVWQVDGRRYVVAAGGAVVNSVRPEDFRALPQIIGLGANTSVAAILPLIAARPKLAARVEALRRVDTRRWDVLTRDHGVILLPDSGEAAALARLDRLDREAGILSLGLARIDLRNSNFTVVRPQAAPAVSTTVSHGV